MPTISPRLTSKLALSETTRPGTVGCMTVQPSTRIISSPIFGS